VENTKEGEHLKYRTKQYCVNNTGKYKSEPVMSTAFWTVWDKENGTQILSSDGRWAK